MNKVTALGARRGTFTAVFLLDKLLTSCATIKTASHHDGNLARE